VKKTSISLFRINAGDRDRQGWAKRTACRDYAALFRASSITWLISASVRPFIASASTQLGFRHFRAGLNGDPIFQPHRNESIWIRSCHPYIVFASLHNPSAKINRTNKLAEREGFEPPIPVKVYTLSRRPVIRR
jgi:hypothetical protein